MEKFSSPLPIQPAGACTKGFGAVHALLVNSLKQRG